MSAQTSTTAVEATLDAAPPAVPPGLEARVPDGPGPFDRLLDLLDNLRSLLVVQPEQRLFWFGVAVVAVLGAWLLSQAGQGSPTRLRRAASTVVSIFRGVALFVGVLLLLSLIPVWLAPALLLAVAAAAAALGWSLRDVLPDIVAAAWLLVERRIRTGMALVGPEDSGVIERMGVRAVSIRTPEGHSKLVPNRRLLAGSYRIEQERWPRVRVELVVEYQTDEARIRQALRDAVLTSADVPAEPEVEIEQNPLEPARWSVETRLVTLARASKFEGELQARFRAFSR